MVPPYILDITNASAATPTDTFVDYNPSGTTGFTDVVYTQSFTTSGTVPAFTVHDIVDINLAANATATTTSVYAIRVASVAGTLTGGTITVDSGGLIIDTAGVLNATPATAFKFGPAPGGTFTAGEGLVAVVSAKAPVVPGTLTANGLTFTGTGNGSSTGTLTLSANNSSTLTGTVTVNSGGTPGGTLIVQNTTLAGNVVVNGGTLTLQSPNNSATLALGTSSTVTLNGGTLSVLIDGTGTGQTLAYNNNVTVNFDATINVNRASANSGNTVQFGNLTLGNATLTKTSGNAYNLSFNGTTTLAGNATLAVNSDSLLLNGAVGDGGSGLGITKTGAGTLTLNASNTYTGPTSVLAGTLNLGAAGVINSNAAVAPGAILQVNAAGNFASGKAATITSNNLSLGVLAVGTDFALPAGLVTSSSSGLLALNTTFGAVGGALNMSTIGNGTFFLGTTAGGTYTPATLGVGAGGVYRLGGGGGALTVNNNVVTGANNLVVGAALANGTGALSNGGGTVNFQVAQGYTGTTTLTSVTVTYLNASANNNAATALTQPLAGDVFLQGSPTINAGPSGQTFSSVVLTIQGKLNYGGNTLTLQQGVTALTGGTATGSGNTVLAAGATLNVANMNELPSGNLQLTNGAFVLASDSNSTAGAPTWTNFMAKYTGGYGAGPNQWQLASGGGFAAQGSGPATILISNSSPSAAYGILTPQTVFDQSFRLGSDRRGTLTGAAGSQALYANAPVVIAQNTVLSGVRTITMAPTGPGVSGNAGTGVVYRITGNLSGAGAPRFAVFDTGEGPGPNGAGFDEAAEMVLAGTNTWTGNPGTIQGVNAGSGGLVLDQNTFIRFASNASLPIGNGGAPAFLAAVRDNATNYAGGFLLTAGDTYTMPAGLRNYPRTAFVPSETREIQGVMAVLG
jgi:autotransporter-associated beta strand protein